LSNLDSIMQKQLTTIVNNDKNELLDKHNNKYIVSIVNSSYEKILKGLGVSNKDLSSEFLEKATLFDTVRNENWRQTFPELAEVLDG